MRRFPAALSVVAAALMLAACASTPDAALTAEERADFYEASVHAPRHFSYRRGDTEVRGAVEDDYRYQADVLVGGAPRSHEVVVDDRRFVQSPPTGAWVADPAGAPGEFARGNPVRDAVRELEAGANAERFRAIVKGAKRYDPASSDYLERNDKFPPHPEDGVRYDALPAPYQPDLLFRQGVPADLDARLLQSFLYVSFWFKDGRVTRIETFFDVDVKRVGDDMRSALAVQAKATGARLDPSVLPPTPAPYREIYTFDYPKDAPVVAAPAPAP